METTKASQKETLLLHSDEKGWGLAFRPKVKGKAKRGGEGMSASFYAQVNKVLEDLKYLGRLDYNTFKSVLFPQATEDYLDEKWLSWNKDRLGFMYSCSPDKVMLLCDYIEICKHGGCGN
jgi:hypothetical protein